MRTMLISFSMYLSATGAGFTFVFETPFILTA
jgi:hypothetical protein